MTIASMQLPFRASLVALLAGCAAGGAGGGAALPYPDAPPAPLAERRVEYPPFSESTLPNGLRVIVVEHASQPLVNVNLYVVGGSAADPGERAGLAGMTAELLTK